jgi:hypothetical protein
MFSDPEVRANVWDSLIKPSFEWGPALPEDRRKYSTSSDRRPHPSGDTLGDDDVFAGAELVDFKHDDDQHPRPDDPNRMVYFEDEKSACKESRASAKDAKLEEEEDKKEHDQLLNTTETA